MTRTIKHQFYFPHSPDAVWEYLTKPELMAQWLMENNFHLQVGAEFQFKTSPIPKLDFDGVFYCKVLEMIPHKKLSYSWQSGPGEGKITLNSVVVWTLCPKDNGTELSLEHSGFEKEWNLDFFNGLNHGWVEKLQNISNLLNAS